MLQFNIISINVLFVSFFYYVSQGLHTFLEAYLNLDFVYACINFIIDEIHRYLQLYIILVWLDELLLLKLIYSTSLLVASDHSRYIKITK